MNTLSVSDLVKKNLALGYTYLGEHKVQNITEPVQVYKGFTDPKEVGKVIVKKRTKPKVEQRMAFGILILLLVVADCLAVWKFYMQTANPPMEVASVKKMAFPLPDKQVGSVLF